MGKRAKPYKPKPFESDGRSNDTSANIYCSMLTAAPWRQLSNGAKVLYLYCKAQYYAEHPKPIPKHEELTESELQRCFTMNTEKWEEYGLYGSKHTFYKDMAQLVAFGFVDIIENGQPTRTKSIYMLSHRWREKPP